MNVFGKMAYKADAAYEKAYETRGGPRTEVLESPFRFPKDLDQRI